MSALASDLRPGHRADGTHRDAAGADLLDPTHSASDDHTRFGGVEPSPPGANEAPSPKWLPSQADALLLIFADALDDMERVRIATENRARSLAQVKGLGGTPEQERMTGLCDGLRALEHGAALELKRALRTHPLGPWVKATVGVGEKQGARLLAAIGDPYWHSQQDRPRTVSELWAYCGYHVLNPGQLEDETHVALAGVQASLHPGQPAVDTHRDDAGVAPSRRKGQRSNWNSAAKMRCYLVAESCMKQTTSPYRTVYDNGRTKYAEATHNAICARCGPPGHPAAEGSPLSAGHQHARGLRLVAKAILRDLWLEARRLHEEA